MTFWAQKSKIHILFNKCKNRCFGFGMIFRYIKRPKFYRNLFSLEIFLKSTARRLNLFDLRFWNMNYWNKIFYEKIKLI